MASTKYGSAMANLFCRLSAMPRLFSSVLKMGCSRRSLYIVTACRYSSSAFSWAPAGPPRRSHLRSVVLRFSFRLGPKRRRSGSPTGSVGGMVTSPSELLTHLSLFPHPAADVSISRKKPYFHTQIPLEILPRFEILSAPKLNQIERICFLATQMTPGSHPDLI
eukprot:1180857-Prorocentrum_minimum.AAC.6